MTEPDSSLYRPCEEAEATGGRGFRGTGAEERDSLRRWSHQRETETEIV